MDEHAEQLRDALTQCEGYCALCIWEEAWAVLDALPDELRPFLEVHRMRLDILMGRKEWPKALILAQGLCTAAPDKAELWFRCACIHAQLGYLPAARNAVGRSVADKR